MLEANNLSQAEQLRRINEQLNRLMMAALVGVGGVATSTILLAVNIIVQTQ